MRWSNAAVAAICTASLAACGGSEADSASSEVSNSSQEADASSSEPTPPGFGDTIEAGLFVTVVIDEPTVHADGQRTWLTVHVTINNDSPRRDGEPVDFGVVCGGGARIGAYILDVGIPSPELPLNDPPTAAAGESSGYVALGLPKGDDGAPVSNCATDWIGVAFLDPPQTPTLVLSDEVTEELQAAIA